MYSIYKRPSVCLCVLPKILYVTYTSKFKQCLRQERRHPKKLQRKKKVMFVVWNKCWWSTWTNRWRMWLLPKQPKLTVAAFFSRSKCNRVHPHMYSFTHLCSIFVQSSANTRKKNGTASQNLVDPRLKNHIRIPNIPSNHVFETGD